MKRTIKLIALLPILMVFMGCPTNSATTNKQSVENHVPDTTAFDDSAFIAVLAKKGVPLTPSGKIDVNDQVTLDSLNAIKKLDLNTEMKSVKGIEYIKNLESLWLLETKIQSIDLTNNIELLSFRAYNSYIGSLDLSKNVKLTTFSTERLTLKELDLSNQMNLDVLFLGDLQNPEKVSFVEKLILPDSSKLTYIDISYTKIKSLDLSKHTLLEKVSARGCGLTSINVSGLTQLKNLTCDLNQLEVLDVRGLVNLSQLYCSYNHLTELHLGDNVKLTQLSCGNNYLTTMDISDLPKEGDNTIDFYPQFEVGDTTKTRINKRAVVVDDGEEIDGESFSPDEEF